MAESCCIVLLILAAIVVANAELDRISFDFADFEDNLQDLSLLGDAKFVRIEGQADGMAVQISGTRENTVGRLLYSYPIRMLDDSASASFATQFCFSMSSFAGDGLAFIVAPDRTTLGASGPWLGLVEGANRTRSEHTFAVEFDSVMNQELLDPNSNHVGVDVETILSTATANASDVSLVLNDGARKCAWIEYDGYSQQLEVRIAADYSDPLTAPLLPIAALPSRPVAALMKHTVKLAPIWRPWMYVGFSSSTGVASQKHKLFSWKFCSGPSNSLKQIIKHLEHQVQRHKLPCLKRGLDIKQVTEQDCDRRLRGVHSLPVDPFSMIPPEGDDSDSGKDSTGTKFDAGIFILLLVGFTCAACITLCLLAGWALMLRRSSDAATAVAYEELS